jgi:hypothetical protein
LGDDFDLEPPDNTNVEMTDQTNQDGINDNDEEEGKKKGKKLEYKLSLPTNRLKRYVDVE